MMWWWHGSGWGSLAMAFLMLAFWGTVIWAVVAVTRGESSRSAATEPETVLARRFAAGEIDEGEYRARLDVLRGSPAVQPEGRTRPH
jgi:putative membrane protein